MVKRKNGGFTLIELLVVIAIIGLLAAVVLASLSGARSKGQDAAVKAELNAARSQAELYAANTGSYSGVCAALPSANGMGNVSGPGILKSAANDVSSSNTVIINGAGATTAVNCDDQAKTQWAIQAPLTTAGQFWCVDSSGSAIQEATVFTATTSVCPTT